MESNTTKDGNDVGGAALGQVYAKALISATEQVGTSEAVMEEFDSLMADVFARLPKLQALLASPRVSFEEKEGLIHRAFAGKMSPLLLNFLKVLCKRHRFDGLRAVHRAAHRYLNELRGRTEVQVITAKPLDGPALEQVTAGLQTALGREIAMTPRVDEALIGGMVVRVGDTVYDSSVVGRLRRWREDATDAIAGKIRSGIEKFVSQS